MIRRAATTFLACLASLACSKNKASESEPQPAVSVAPSAAPVASAVPALPSAQPKPVSELPQTRNVLLITIDSLRADMPWAGYARPIAPNLTKLAERSALYLNAYSGSSYTAKSVATFLSGRYPSTLYRDGYFFAKYPASNTFIPELLSPKGIRTLGFHAHLYFGRGKGLEQGFDEWRLVPGITFDPQTDNFVTSDKMTELAIKLLSDPKNTEKPFFAWGHYMDPHDQYQKHKESPDFGNKARDRYDSEVWYSDYWVGKLLEWAESKPWWKNTVLIVSADHGEAFGEHGMYKHAFEVWEVLTRVPLLIAGPGIVPRRIEQRRSHIDLAPTILELMGQPVPADFHGKSLVPELTGAALESHEPILVELTEDSHNPYRRALIDGKYKLIDLGRSQYQLYDLSRDPGELTDLAKEQKDELARMRKLLDDKLATLPLVEPYGGAKLKNGKTARGPVGPEK
ncbi:MAG: sulfatase [Myxococcota bacterium]